MQPTFKNILKVLAIPTGLLLIYFSFVGLWLLFDLPAQDELLEITAVFVNQYGLPIIFIAAIVEGVLLFGNYFPGGVVIFLGVIAAAAVNDIPRAILVVLVVCLAFFIAYIFNYFLGRYGWYTLFVKFGLQSTLESMQKKLSRHAFTAILSSYWHPNLAAVCSTAAGILQTPFRKFLIESTIGLVVWNIFWGVFVYITGDALLKLDIIFVLLIFVAWCSLILFKVFVWDRRVGRDQILEK